VHLEVNRKSPFSGKCETGVLVNHASDCLKCVSIGDVSFCVLSIAGVARAHKQLITH